MTSNLAVLQLVRSGCSLRDKSLADLCRKREWNYSWLSKIMNSLSPTPATFWADCQEVFDAWDKEREAAVVEHAQRIGLLPAERIGAIQTPIAGTGHADAKRG